jgi:hypothetical protein
LRYFGAVVSKTLRASASVIGLGKANVVKAVIIGISGASAITRAVS